MGDARPFRRGSIFVRAANSLIRRVLPRFILVLALCGAAIGQEPAPLTISVPEKVPAYRTVLVEVTPSAEVKSVRLRVRMVTVDEDVLLPDVYGPFPASDGKLAWVWTWDPGFYTLEVDAISGEQIVSAYAFTIIGDAQPPQPPIPPPPTPDVPPDQFDNVGQLSFRLAKALPSAARSKSKAVADIYRRAADGLEDGSLINVTVAARRVQEQRTSAVGDQSPPWNALVADLKTTWDKFWPMDKAKVALFYRAVAAGLEAGGS